MEYFFRHLLCEVKTLGFYKIKESLTRESAFSYQVVKKAQQLGRDSVCRELTKCPDPTRLFLQTFSTQC